MWHEDLPAWQTYRETILTPSPGAPVAVQLCSVDTARVYLRIARPDHDYAWLSLTKPTAAFQGFPFGFQQRIVTSPDTTTAITGNLDPVTGDANLVFSVPLLNTGAFQHAPSIVEFFHGKHGILSQQAWWAWDPLPGCPWYILELLMDRNPCDSNLGKRQTDERRSRPLPLQGISPIWESNWHDRYAPDRPEQ